MSRRTDLVQELVKSKNLGQDKENEQKYLTATAELILTDLISIAMTGVEKHGAGVLVLNLLNDSTKFMSGDDLKQDIYTAEKLEDEETLTMLRQLLEEVDENDWSTTVLITLLSDAGTRTFAVEAGGSQESLRAIAAEFSG